MKFSILVLLVLALATFAVRGQESSVSEAVSESVDGSYEGSELESASADYADETEEYSELSEDYSEGSEEEGEDEEGNRRMLMKDGKDGKGKDGYSKIANIWFRRCQKTRQILNELRSWYSRQKAYGWKNNKLDNILEKLKKINYSNYNKKNNKNKN